VVCCVTIAIICVANICSLSFPNLSCLNWALKELKELEISKIKDLKLQIGIVIKLHTKQGSKYYSFGSFESVIHMTRDTVQLAFNHLSYKPLF